jgi:hypothetical protein
MKIMADRREARAASFKRVKLAFKNDYRTAFA